MEKILKIIKNGIFIGFILLITAYFGIYLIAGDNAFKQEILNLTNIHTLGNQIIISSIIGILISGLIEYGKIIYVKIIENQKKADIKKSIKIVLLDFLPIYIIVILIIFIIDRSTNIYSESIRMLFAINFIIGMCLVGLTTCIKSVIDEFFVNKKINEINKE